MTFKNSSHKKHVITDLLSITKMALNGLSSILEKVRILSISKLENSGLTLRQFIDCNQTFCHSLAWLCTYHMALNQMQEWSEKLHSKGQLGDVEYLINQIAFSEYLAQIKGGIPMSQGEIIRLSNLGINIDDEPFFKNPY